MIRRRLIAGLALASVMIATDARAGFDDGKRLEKSPVRAGIATHIVVGQLLRYAPAGPGEGDGDHARGGLTRSAAEIEVAAIEKGTGITPGSVIRVAFGSPLTTGQLEFVRGSGGDCGDYWWFPIPGETARLYLTRRPDGRFVADHPYDFYAIGNFAAPDVLKARRDRYVVRRRADLAMASILRVLGVAGPVILIVAALAVVLHRRRRMAVAPI